MTLDEIRYHPIGIIHSPHRKLDEMPIQPVFAQKVAGTAVLEPAWVEGLRDLEGFSHIFLIYHFHLAAPARLSVRPPLDDNPHGVFATRAPCRPNPIGLSLVRLVKIEGPVLHLEDLDVLDGTPLLDIKPYAPRFDERTGARSGWLERVDEEKIRRRSQGGAGQGV